MARRGLSGFWAEFLANYLFVLMLFVTFPFMFRFFNVLFGDGTSGDRWMFGLILLALMVGLSILNYWRKDELDVVRDRFEWVADKVGGLRRKSAK